jgi:dTDP-4-dehydrorhamnose reductase
MRWLILGAGGQVGQALCRIAADQNLDAVALHRHDLDLLNAAALREALVPEAYDLVINAAAYTAVDRAETEPKEAMAVNAEAPRAIAELCRERGLPLVHFSTDYVFDGRNAAPYLEDDSINPLSVYGQSKAAGETAIRDAQPRHLILRTSWVFSADGQNFVKSMLRLSRDQKRLRIVDDQRGGPTSAKYLAAAVGEIAEQIVRGKEIPWGSYHLSGAPAVTWYEFAVAIFSEWQALTGKSPPQLQPITTADYPTAAPRPGNSVLDCRRIEEAFGVRPGDWRADLRETLEILKGDRPS